MEKKTHTQFPSEKVEKPSRKMEGNELYSFAAECCRYVEKQMVNDKEYFIVNN